MGVLSPKVESWGDRASLSSRCGFEPRGFTRAFERVNRLTIGWADSLPHVQRDETKIGYSAGYTRGKNGAPVIHLKDCRFRELRGL